MTVKLLINFIIYRKFNKNSLQIFIMMSDLQQLPRHCKNHSSKPKHCNVVHYVFVAFMFFLKDHQGILSVAFVSLCS